MNDEIFELSPDQTEALNIMRGGENVFLTGAAGTGKSTVVREFAKTVSPKTFPMLASTGVAAVLVGGRTFHSFFALGVMEGGEDQTIDRALEDRKLHKRIKNLDGFLIDEVSMLPASALRAAEVICRRIRDVEMPWGGLQVIAVGDFAQLPPVEGFGRTTKSWAFQHETWQSSQFVNAYLQTNLRSRDDDFLSVLGEIRRGQVSDGVRTFLDSKTDEYSVGSDRTHLFPRRDQTDQFNEKKLAELPGEVFEIRTIYEGQARVIEQLKRAAPIPEVLRIKLGSRVMLRQNDPRRRWVNGSVGVVKEITKEEIFLELLSGRDVKIEKANFATMRGDGSIGAVAINFPLNLAYASTIHKSQGATLDEVVLDLARLWEPGHAYVALSRVRTPEGIKIVRWSETSIKADAQVLEFYKNLETHWKKPTLSIVGRDPEQIV